MLAISALLDHMMKGLAHQRPDHLTHVGRDLILVLLPEDAHTRTVNDLRDRQPGLAPGVSVAPRQID